MAQYIIPSVICIVYGAIIALVVICLVRVSNYFRSAGKEQKLMRMELAKLAEEVHLIRHKLENHVEGEHSGSSQ